MRSLAEVDRDLDELAVPAARLAETRARAAAARPTSLAEADAELSALATGTTPVARVARAAPAPSPAPVAPAPAPVLPAPEDGPSSGLIQVSDAELRDAELPAVLALEGVEPAPASAHAVSPHDEIAGALSALALDLDSGEMPIEMGPEPSVARGEDFVSQTSPPPAFEPGFDDPNADLADLLGEADPLRESEAAPSAPLEELEEEHTVMFSAADADRFSRPPPPEDGAEDDFELDIEEVEIDEDELMEAEASSPKTQPPPPPPRTSPPEPPKGARPSEAPRGFLGKLLQRKP